MGHQVVATIHQPSSRLLDQFDHLYIVANGSCIYQGPVESLVPYLKLINLSCPSYHNPADFGDIIHLRLIILFKKFHNISYVSFQVMDVASGEYGDVLPLLTSGVQNGRLIYNQDSASTTIDTPSHGNEGNAQDFLYLKLFIYYTLI